jgi:pilus assembly protein CpaF
VARAQIASAIGVIVQASRLTDGKRKLMSIQEITGMEGDMITMQEVFTFRQQGISEAGVVQGQFAATGVRPQFADRLRSFGIRLPEDMFDPTRRFE